MHLYLDIRRSLKPSNYDHDTTSKSSVMREPQLGPGALGRKRTSFKTNPGERGELLLEKNAEAFQDSYVVNVQKSNIKSIHSAFSTRYRSAKDLLFERTMQDESILNFVKDDNEDGGSEVSSLFSDTSYEPVVLAPGEYLFSDDDLDDDEIEESFDT